ASAAMGTTVRDALGRFDLGAVNVLKPEVKRLRARLRSGIRPRLCWKRFVEETGSEMAKRSVGMFYDVVEVGGDPEQAGHRASLYASTVSMLRAKRKTLSSPFRWLCIAMHAAVIALLVFIVEVMANFGALVAKAQASLPDISQTTPFSGSFGTFNYDGLGFMHRLVLPLVVVFTVANALAPSIADGGGRSKIFYNLGITAAISGFCVAVLPPVASMVFASMQR
ncbi:MAG: type II secretion system F family protein, partial [Chloroflexi bacterium]|nr:type II secretion system F family protein [Chloroflexota bacterium]